MTAMKRDARWLQAENLQFQNVERRFDIVYFREVSGNVGEMVDAVRNDGEKMIHMNKTHGAMIRFASEEDEDLKAVMAVLRGMIEEISEKTKRESEPGRAFYTPKDQPLSLNKRETGETTEYK
jgi:hypothetical protein